MVAVQGEEKRQEIMTEKKTNPICSTCGQIIQVSLEENTTLQLTEEDKEKLIEEIKNKAVKATMDTIAPLLEKLQQAAQESQHKSAGLSTEDQLQKMHEAAREKMNMRQIKLQERLQSLQLKVSKIS